MLRFTYPVGLGLAALVALPAALSKQSLDGGPEDALEATLAAIDELLLVSDALERREAGSIQRLLDRTQPPVAPVAEQDAFLAELRREVGELQLALAPASPYARPGGTAVTGSTPSNGTSALPGDTGTSAGTPADDAASRVRAPRPYPGTTGASLAPPGDQPGNVVDRTQGPADTQGASVPSRGGTSTPVETTAPANRKPSIEGEGYVADTLRHGRLLFRSKRFSEAIDVLSTLETDPEARYWVARALEALGDEQQASRRYRELIDDPAGPEHIARRAQQDLSFLEWKRHFEQQGEK